MLSLVPLLFYFNFIFFCFTLLNLFLHIPLRTYVGNEVNNFPEVLTLIYCNAYPILNGKFLSPVIILFQFNSLVMFFQFPYILSTCLCASARFYQKHAIICLYDFIIFNPFVSSARFLYSLKTSENLTVF